MHQRDILGLAAAHIDGSDAVAGNVHFLDDVTVLERDGFESDIIFEGEVGKGVVLAIDQESPRKWMERTKVRPTNDPRIWESAMGERFP